MEPLTTKLVTMVLFGGLSLLVGLATYQFRKLLKLSKADKGSKRWQEVASSMLLCFGGGVLLATALLHILPEVREGLEEEERRLGLNCLAELVLCAGFFLVYLLEELVHFLLRFVLHSSALHQSVAVRRPGPDADCCSVKSYSLCPDTVERADREATAGDGDGYSRESSQNEFLKLSGSADRSSIRDCFTGEQITRSSFFAVAHLNHSPFQCSACLST